MKAPDSTETIDRLEESLGPELRHFLRVAYEMLELPPSRRDRWPQVPALRVFETLATVRKARELQVTKGLSSEAALAEAAMELGIPLETIRARLYRAFRASGETPC